MKVQVRPPAPGVPLLRATGLELNRQECVARLDENELHLTRTEFRLLEFLMSRPGVVFSRSRLLDAVWGFDRNVTGRTVDVYVLRLRCKIEADPPNPRLLRSARAFGYSFSPPRSAVDSAAV